jgi:hypothetical protein
MNETFKVMEPHGLGRHVARQISSLKVARGARNSPKIARRGRPSHAAMPLALVGSLPPYRSA